MSAASWAERKVGKKPTIESVMREHLRKREAGTGGSWHPPEAVRIIESGTQAVVEDAEHPGRGLKVFASKAHAQAAVRKASDKVIGEWQESQHPRGPDGKFS